MNSRRRSRVERRKIGDGDGNYGAKGAGIWTDVTPRDNSQLQRSRLAEDAEYGGGRQRLQTKRTIWYPCAERCGSSRTYGSTRARVSLSWATMCGEERSWLGEGRISARTYLRAVQYVKNEIALKHLRNSMREMTKCRNEFARSIQHLGLDIEPMTSKITTPERVMEEDTTRRVETVDLHTAQRDNVVSRASVDKRESGRDTGVSRAKRATIYDETDAIASANFANIIAPTDILPIRNNNDRHDTVRTNVENASNVSGFDALVAMDVISKEASRANTENIASEFTDAENGNESTIRARREYVTVNKRLPHKRVLVDRETGWSLTEGESFSKYARHGDSSYRLGAEESTANVTVSRGATKNDTNENTVVDATEIRDFQLSTSPSVFTESNIVDSADVTNLAVGRVDARRMKTVDRRDEDARRSLGVARESEKTVRENTVTVSKRCRSLLERALATSEFQRDFVRAKYRFVDVETKLASLRDTLSDEKCEQLDQVYELLYYNYLRALFETSLECFRFFDEYASKGYNLIGRFLAHEDTNVLRDGTNKTAECWLLSRICNEYARASFYRLLEYARCAELRQRLHSLKANVRDTWTDNDDGDYESVRAEILQLLSNKHGAYSPGAPLDNVRSLVDAIDLSSEIVELRGTSIALGSSKDDALSHELSIACFPQTRHLASRVLTWPPWNMTLSRDTERDDDPEADEYFVLYRLNAMATSTDMPGSDRFYADAFERLIVESIRQ